MDLKRIKEIAFTEMGERRSKPNKDKGNKYFHGQRVANTALNLRKIILPENDSYDEILIVAAWFHDILNGIDMHCELGAKKTKELLLDYSTNEELEKICEIIAVHDFRDPDDNNYSEYTKIFQDADLLDHFGSYLIFANFYGRNDMNIMECKDLMWNRVNKFGDFRTKINYDVTKKIFDEKTEFYLDFAKRFDSESNGEIYNLDFLMQNKQKKQ